MASVNILKIKESKLINLSIISMIAASTIDQGGGLFIKYLSFIIGLFTISFFRLKWEGPLKLWLNWLYIIWPLCSISIGILNNGTFSLILNNVSPFIAGFIMLYLLTYSNVKLALETLNISLLIMSVTSIILYIAFVLFPASIEPLSELLINKQMGFFGIKAIEETGFPGIYFKCTLFYNFAFISFLFSRKYIYSLIVLTAIILSFSKSAIVASTLTILIFALNGLQTNANRHIYIKYSSILILMIFSFVALIFFQSEYNQTFLSYFENTITGQAGTSKVRVGHFQSIIKLFSDNPSYLLFGQGAGTEFFTHGFNAFTNNIELDHLNAVRKFGLIWALPFYGLIGLSIYSLIKRKYTSLALAYSVTFILVGTNPLMINPLFIIITIIFYKLITHNKRNDYGLRTYI